MNEYFEYLTDLRDSGTMNMMWAPTMLQADFDLDKKEAREIFSKWCESLKPIEDKPEDGKQYLLIGGADKPSIANGNSWAESEVKE